jgi:hypothetical protein
MTAPLDVWAFLRKVDGMCAEAGARFRLEARQRTRGGEKGGVLGYFDESKPELFVCVLSAKWPMLLAHETGHLEQMMDKAHQWDVDYLARFESWYMGKRRMKAANVLIACRAVQKMELDAERRAVRFAKKFHLTDDIAKYIRGANLYIWRYEVARRLGRWPEYADALETVEAAMPDKLMRVTDIDNPPAIMEALVKA